MKIKFYTHRGCGNCMKVKSILQKTLPEYGLAYASSTSELDIDNADVLAELLMMDTESVPVVVIGEKTLSGPSVLDETLLRSLLLQNLESLKSNA